MSASDLYKAGQLAEAIDAQIKEVKLTPADHGKRLFLFEMLAFAGELDRARRQIEAINYQEIELDAAVMSYRKLLDAEQLRRRLFSESLKPQFFADPPEHVQMRLDAIGRLRENDLAGAAALLTKANESLPALHGELNEKPFVSLRDCDDLFAGVLEVMANGVYYWVPLDQVESVTTTAPRFPRDLLWLSGRLEMKESAGNVFLPTLYPRSHEHADTQIKLGRATDWKTPANGPALGVGARLFLVGDDAVSVLEWRTLEIEPAASGASAP